MLLCQLWLQWQTFPYPGCGHVWCVFHCLLYYWIKALMQHSCNLLLISCKGVLRYNMWLCLLWSGLSKYTISKLFFFSSRFRTSYSELTLQSLYHAGSVTYTDDLKSMKKEKHNKNMLSCLLRHQRILIWTLISHNLKPENWNTNLWYHEGVKIGVTVMRMPCERPNSTNKTKSIGLSLPLRQ